MKEERKSMSPHPLSPLKGGRMRERTCVRLFSKI
jgi:hypothetical protein